MQEVKLRLFSFVFVAEFNCDLRSRVRRQEIEE